MIVAVRHQQGDGGKPIQDFGAGFGTGKALKKLLQNETGGDDRLAGFERSNQHLHFDN